MEEKNYKYLIFQLFLFKFFLTIYNKYSSPSLTHLPIQHSLLLLATAAEPLSH